MFWLSQIEPRRLLYVSPSYEQTWGRPSVELFVDPLAWTNPVIAEDKDRAAVTGPLVLLDMRNRLDVFVNVRGGGTTGQAGATMQGLARALKTMFGEDAPAAPAPAPAAEGAAEAESTEGGIAKKLRDSGFLTRDSRMKERKKYGRKGARRSFQFSKR